MKRILIQIKDNTIYFKSKRSFNEEQKNILNTNIISDNELVFTDEYIYENLNIVSSFLLELVKEHNITNCSIYNTSVVIEILDILKKIPNVTFLNIKDDVPISFKICEKISKLNSLESISVHSLHDFMIEFLDKFGINVESRSEMLFTSKFMELNSLNKYSSIFYKKSINIEFPMNDNDFDELGAFFTINKYLKVIHINKTIKSDLEYLIRIMNHYKIKNIKIIIHENINDISLIEYIKKINDQSKKKLKISIIISYSDEYLKKNFLPQTNISILKLCILIILLIVGGSFGYVFVNNFMAYQKDIDIKNELKVLIEDMDPEIIINDLNIDNKELIVNDYIASIMTLNKDTVGWITVNNTKIDYPVLQTDNNDYYLEKNINLKHDLNGWIFMDYKNTSSMNDENTIIYGHTRYNSAVMFGTLKNIEDEKWYTNEENLIIRYDTLYKSYEYKIFSYYTTGITTDYLKQNFGLDTEKEEFFNMLTKRSEIDFNTKVNVNDKILTLSTCEDGGYKRLVVHAVLLNG